MRSTERWLKGPPRELTKNAVARILKLGPPALQVAGHDRGGLLMEGDDPLFFPLAHDPHQPFGEMDILGLQPGQFGDAQAGRV